ncbi:hypothetical protein DPMN_014700 [Dreissena polymorpha]|uniref:Uncharacterized protein n=1 Tax=Dreissena polymorpha TaxID=45954 RepID=A0A9D4N7T7_DREPO|nr:hypothetical protein DPMN_014700 [Dreissena polymorpha]
MSLFYIPPFPLSSTQPVSASVSVRRHLSKSPLLYDPVIPTSFPYQCQCLCQETS